MLDARTRPMRADALRNRALLLDAARAVFRRDGLSLQMDDVAAEAGLGVGTLYRHFPTKEALIGVLIEERLAQLAAAAKAAAQAQEPWDAVASLVWELARFEAEDRGMADILFGSSRQLEPPEEPMTELMECLKASVARAQAAGQMRSDVSAQDVLIAVCGVGRMMTPSSDDSDGRWRRLIGVILDGLRASTL